MIRQGPETDAFTKMLELAVKHEVDRILAEEAETAKTNVERRVRNTADTIALNILSQYHVQTMKNEIVITVSKETLE